VAEELVAFETYPASADFTTNAVRHRDIKDAAIPTTANGIP